jgi:hypothetical protein
MEYIVVAFRSREHTVKFSGYLTARGIPNTIINTPKEAGVGCGLSVKIDKNAFFVVKNLLATGRPNSFAGFFSVIESHGGRVVKTI